MQHARARPAVSAAALGGWRKSAVRLRWSGFEGESGLTEESGDETGPVLNAPEPVPDCRRQLVQTAEFKAELFEQLARRSALAEAASDLPVSVRDISEGELVTWGVPCSSATSTRLQICYTKVARVAGRMLRGVDDCVENADRGG
jgi:hypothetical protein